MEEVSSPSTSSVLGISDLSVEGRRVFVRADFNVPLTPSRGIADDTRIRAALPTLQALRERGARLVIGSHLGRPKGQVKEEFSLEPVGSRLAELLDTEVRLTDEPAGDGARKVVSDLRDGHVALLENLRFDPGEEANDDGFSHTLASYADVYVNDAFGTAHRAHASTSGMVAHMGEKAAGLLMTKEIEFLSRLLGQVDRPYVAVVGGVKVSGKLDVLSALADRVDSIVIGGAMANTFLLAQGHGIGKSLVEDTKLALARSFLKQAEDKGVRVLLPRDLLVAESPDAPWGSAVAMDACPDNAMALDIGPETIQVYSAELKAARTIFWNGPMGMFEKKPFVQGTIQVGQAIASNRQALTVVGGGDSASAVKQAGITAELSHISTGGGASLEFIQGKLLPGIAALRVRSVL